MKQKLLRIIKNKDMSLAKGSVVSLITQVSGVCLLYGIHIFIARWMGIKSYGMYNYTINLVSFFVILSQMGLHSGVLRFSSTYYMVSDWNKLKGLIYSSHRIVILTSITIVSICLVIINICHLESQLTYSIRIGIWLVPILVLTHLRQQILRGLKRIFASQAPEQIATPLFMGLISFLFIYFTGTLNVTQAIFSHIIACILALVFGWFLLVRALPKEFAKVKPEYNTKELLKVSFPMLLASGMQVVLSRTDIILIQYFLGIESVGVYSAATKLATLITFPLNAVNSIAAPMISRLYHKGNHNELQQLVTKTTMWISLVSIPMSLVLILWGEFFLSLFGSDFVQGRSVLTILVLGQLVNAIVGPVGFLMIMTGHQNEFSKVITLSTCINVIFNPIGMLYMGIEGSAIVTCISIVIWNVWLLLLAYKRLHIISIWVPGIIKKLINNG